MGEHGDVVLRAVLCGWPLHMALELTCRRAGGDVPAKGRKNTCMECKASTCASLGNEQKHAMQPCFLSCSPLSQSMSPFPVCADEHVTLPLRLAHINTSKPNFNHITLFSCALLSSPPLALPPCPCPSCLLPLTLIIKRSKPFLKKSKPSCLSHTSCLG